MVTQDQLRDYIGRRPFVPFRVTLRTGETVDVTRTLQAVAMVRDLVVADETNDRFRWIKLDQIDGIQPFELRPTA